MGSPAGTQDPRRFRMQHSLRILLPVGGVFAALAAISIVYLSYDLVKDKMSPCEGNLSPDGAQSVDTYQVS